MLEVVNILFRKSDPFNDADKPRQEILDAWEAGELFYYYQTALSPTLPTFDGQCDDIANIKDFAAWTGEIDVQSNYTRALPVKFFVDISWYLHPEKREHCDPDVIEENHKWRNKI